MLAMQAWVHVSELMRNHKNLEHVSKVIKHASFNRVHKNKIYSLVIQCLNQVKNELYHK